MPSAGKMNLKKKKKKKKRVVATAEFDFEAENPMELSISFGDVVKIVDCNPRRGWWLVENKAGGSGYVSAAKADSALTLAEKLAGGLITEAEHDHIVRVCIEATEAIEADDTAVDAEAAAKRSAGELSAAGGSRGGGGGGGSSSNDVVVKKKTGNVVLDYPLSPPPSSNSPKLVRQAGKSPMPTNRSDQRAVQAAVQAMTKAGIPQDTCETRISDLVGFGFDAVKAALCLRQTNGDIAEAMALLLDSEDGGI
eukprot:gene1573-2691_t